MTSGPVPPGPRGSLLLGNLRDFAADTLGFFERNLRQYGDVVRARLFDREVILLGHPDLVEEVLLTHHRSFVKHTFFWRHVRAIFGQGLLTSEGDFWLHQRRLAAPAFHARRIAGYADIMVRFTESMLARWQDGQRLDVHHEMMQLTMEIVAKTLFDAEVDEHEEISRAFEEVIAEIALRFRMPLPIPDWVPIPRNRRYLRAVGRLEGLVYRFIAERRASPGDRGDLLSMLLAARDDDGRAMSDKQLRDESITLFLAGHETTAITLSWTWYLLARHPEVETRLAAELDAVLGERAPTLEDLPRLVYAEQVIKESMRLFPPAYAFGREAIEPVEIGGYPLREGTTVFMSPLFMHHDERWFAQPEQFRPERWTAELEGSLPRYAYLPFGGGPRICIGNRFAMMEAVLLLATIARRFRLRLQDERPIATFPSITLRPQGGVPVVLAARRPGDQQKEGVAVAAKSA